MHVKARGYRFIMGHINPAASRTLQHGVWAASQYFNSNFIKNMRNIAVANVTAHCERTFIVLCNSMTFCFPLGLRITGVLDTVRCSTDSMYTDTQCTDLLHGKVETRYVCHVHITLPSLLVVL